MSGYAFISYSSEDKAYVVRLADHLRQSGIDVRYDPHIGPGHRFASAIEKMINGCSAVIVVMTPESNSSHWVGVEVDHALSLGKPILPLLLKGRRPRYEVRTIEYEDVRRRGDRMPSTRFLNTLRRHTGLPAQPLPRRDHRGVSRRRLLIAGGSVAAAGVVGAAYAVGRIASNDNASPANSTPTSPTPAMALFTGELAGHTDAVLSVAWAPDGRRLSTGSYDGTVKIWDTVTGQEIRTLIHDRGTQIWAVPWSADGTRLASCSEAGSAKIWVPATGREVYTLNVDSGGMADVAWSPDGTRLATATRIEIVKIWNAATAEEIRTLTDQGDWVYSLAWSPDGARLATGSGGDGSWGGEGNIPGAAVQIWDSATGQEILALDAPHSHFVYSVAWSPDGTMLATGSLDGTAKIWDSTTGQRIHTLAGHDGGVNSVAWSPHGTSLATGSHDGTIKLWSSATGAEVRTLNGHSSGVTSVAWSGDGFYLASASDDSTARIWRVDEG